MLRRRSAGKFHTYYSKYEGSDTRIIGKSERKTASTSKLGVIFKNSGPTLEDALDDFESTSIFLFAFSKLAQKWADVQRRGADRFSQWARKGGNAAIDDITERIRDLLHLHAEQQSKLSEEISNYVQLLQVYKTLNLNPRANKKFASNLHFKGLADSYVDYSERTQDIFGCHREITELVPAIATEDVRYMKYEGAVISRDRVEQLRRSVFPHLFCYALKLQES
uniref:BAR domain-containing protein n=1 Tax=Heterorhabditis bacteriophora TaxID=37862 RepID=A0A1I7XE54_HETBA